MTIVLFIWAIFFIILLCNISSPWILLLPLITAIIIVHYDDEIL